MEVTGDAGSGTMSLNSDDDQTALLTTNSSAFIDTPTRKAAPRVAIGNAGPVLATALATMGLTTFIALLAVFGPRGPPIVANPSWAGHAVLVAPAGVSILLSIAGMVRRGAAGSGGGGVDALGAVAGALSVAVGLLPATGSPLLQAHGHIIVPMLVVVDGLAVFAASVSVSRALHRKAVFAELSSVAVNTVPSDAWCTVAYTEFGVVLPGAFKHVRVGDRTVVTVGTDRNADLCLGGLPPPDYGLREYDLRTKERVDCDQVVNDRRRLVAREHCSLIRDEHTNNVYVKTYPSVRAVTYIGLEDQGRFDPISLQWQGTSDTDLNDPGEFVEVVNDTKARVCLPDNPTAFKIYDHHNFQRQIWQCANAGKDPRAELYRFTNVVVVVGSGEPLQHDRNADCAIRVVLHDARMLLDQAPPPFCRPPKGGKATATPSRDGGLSPVPGSVDGRRSTDSASGPSPARVIASYKKQVKELHVQLAAEVANTTDAANTCMALQERCITAEHQVAKIKVKAEAKFKELKKSKSTLAAEIANLKETVSRGSPGLPTTSDEKRRARFADTVSIDSFGVEDASPASPALPRQPRVRAKSANAASKAQYLSPQNSGEARTTSLSDDSPSPPPRLLAGSRQVMPILPAGGSPLLRRLIGKDNDKDKALKKECYRPPGSPSMRQRELILNAVAAQSPVLARKMGQARAAARAASP